MMRRIICGPCGSSWSSVDYTANRWSLSGEAPCVLENVSKHLCSVFETLIEGCSTCTWLCNYMSTVLVSCSCSWTLISQMCKCWIQWICISIFFLDRVELWNNDGLQNNYFCKKYLWIIFFSSSETMSVPTFHYIQVQLFQYYEMIMMEKKEAKVWAKR